MLLLDKLTGANSLGGVSLHVGVEGSLALTVQHVEALSGGLGDTNVLVVHSFFGLVCLIDFRRKTVIFLVN